jgi:hypothetical protein
MTRDKMIDAIVNSVDGWSLSELVGWIKHRIRDEYSIMTPDAIQYDYEWYVGEDNEI